MPRGSRRPSLAIRADLEKQVTRGRLGEGKARFLGSIVTGVDRHRRVRRLRPRDRGGVRGDRRQAGGLRRARGRRLGGVPARHEHVVPLGRRDGRRPPPSGTGRRDALLQPRRRAPARRARARSGHRRRDARDRLGRDEEARQARRPRQGRAGVRRQSPADPPVDAC